MTTKRWNKTPSVTYGGKAYFFTQRAPNGDMWRVAWDRRAQDWIAETGPGNGVVVGHFDTPEKAKHFLESYY